MADHLEQRFLLAFSSAMHSIHNLAAKVMKHDDIPFAQYRLLMLLREKKQLTITDISSMLSIAQSTASELAARAVESGLISKTGDAVDRRRTLFTLTQKAALLLNKKKRQMVNIYSAVLDPLCEQERVELVNAFETIAALLKLNHLK
ncbi:MAG: MarR family transcriptional regulator [Calditrichaeota bacterium]|nr:MAG: MarR family transcriptional regulator [Calditrichota bacterium]